MIGVKHSMVPSSLGNKPHGKNYVGNKQYPHSVTGNVKTNQDTPVGDNQYNKDAQYLPTGLHNSRRTKENYNSLEKK